MNVDALETIKKGKNKRLSCLGCGTLAPVFGFIKVQFKILLKNPSIVVQMGFIFLFLNHIQVATRVNLCMIIHLL